MRAPALLVVLMLLPLGTGQGHEHDTAPVRIATDLNDDGLAIAGHPTHFSVVAFGDDEVPDFHQDIPLRVWFNDTILWEETALSGHDYDGINSIAVAFPGPGTWRVEAVDEAGMVLAQRNGTVVAADGAPAALEVETSTSGGLQRFTYRIAENGTRINHVDAWFEVWRDGMIWFRTHTHTHDDDQVADVRLPDGTYDIRITGYVSFPTATGPRFEALVHEQPLTVRGGAPGLPAMGAPTPPADANAAVLGTNTSPYRLVGTYDPFTRVGPDTLQHLSALVVDEHGDAVQHVDFEATLRGPGGVLFASDTLHEYDGIYDLATRQTQPGTYWLDVTATRGDWSDSIQLPYTVLPPAVATVAGPQIVTLDGALESGLTGDLSLNAANPAGVPFAHGEMEVQVWRSSDRPALVHAKLHTHGGGGFPFRLALAHEGAHELVVTPFPLDPQPVLGYHKDQLGNPLDFTLDVTQGPGFPAGPMRQVIFEPDDAEAPGLAMVMVLAVLGGLLALRRRG